MSDVVSASIPPYASSLWARARTLDDWQTAFRLGAITTYRWHGPEDIWVRFAEHAGGVARLIRRYYPKRAHELYAAVVDDKALPSALSWLIILCVRLDVSLNDITWAKFPGVCPYCVADDDIPSLAGGDAAVEMPAPSVGLSWRLLTRCECKTRPRQYRSDRVRALRSRRDCTPETLGEWQAMFEALYGDLHSDTKVAVFLAYHFVEEMGEVATELRRQDVAL